MNKEKLIIEKLTEKLKTQGDISYKDSDKIYKTFLSFFGGGPLPVMSALLNWYNAVLEKLKAGKKGAFIHTLPFLPAHPILSNVIDECFFMLGPVEKLYFIQGNERTIKQLVKTKNLTENEGYWGIQDKPRGNGTKKITVTRAYGLQRLASITEIERDRSFNIDLSRTLVNWTSLTIGTADPGKMSPREETQIVITNWLLKKGFLFVRPSDSHEYFIIPTGKDARDMKYAVSQMSSRELIIKTMKKTGNIVSEIPDNASETVTFMGQKFHLDRNHNKAYLPASRGKAYEFNTRNVLDIFSGALDLQTGRIKERRSLLSNGVFNDVLLEKY